MIPVRRTTITSNLSPSEAVAALDCAIRATNTQANMTAGTILGSSWWLNGSPAVGRFRLSMRSSAVVAYRPVMDAVLVASGTGSRLVANVRPPVWDMFLIAAGVIAVEAYALVTTGLPRWLPLGFGVLLHVFAHHLNFVPLAKELESMLTESLVTPGPAKSR